MLGQEVIDDVPTGNTGIISFYIPDTTIAERYNSHVTIDHFSLSNIEADHCGVESFGRIDIIDSLFINNAGQTLLLEKDTARIRLK